MHTHTKPKSSLPRYTIREQVLCDLILPNRRHRRHSKAKLTKLRKSIERFGVVTPLIVDADGNVLDGYARLVIARELDLKTVRTVVADGFSAEEKKALALALNRLSEEAEWDQDAVAATLTSIIEIDDTFDLELTGFEVPEIDQIIIGAEERGRTDAIDQNVGEPPVRPVAQQGDVFALGDHCVFCGSCFDPGFKSELLGGVSAQVVFTDPPYNVKIDGTAVGAGRIHHREFPMASGEMSEAEFTEFLTKSLGAQIAPLEDGGLAYVCMDWRHIQELLSASRALDLKQINLCVWVKSNGGMGSYYRSQHELVFVYRKGSAPHRNNVQLGRFGRNRTNVWHYDGVNTLKRGRREELALHPTVKSVPMIEDAILDCTTRGNLVIDGFLGSGTTLLAAERTGRICYGAELDCGYVDLIIDRWQTLTGRDAIHVASGRTFKDLRARRHRNRPPLPSAA